MPQRILRHARVHLERLQDLDIARLQCAARTPGYALTSPVFDPSSSEIQSLCAMGGNCGARAVLDRSLNHVRPAASAVQQSDVDVRALGQLRQARVSCLHVELANVELLVHRSRVRLPIRPGLAGRRRLDRCRRGHPLRCLRASVTATRADVRRAQSTSPPSAAPSGRRSSSPSTCRS